MTLHELREWAASANPRERIAIADRYFWALLEVAEASIALHDVVGDGDNGPAPTFADAWNELDGAFNRLQSEAGLYDEERVTPGSNAHLPAEEKRKILDHAFGAWGPEEET